MPADAEPRPVGRPTDYDPTFCDLVIEFGKAGKSKVVMAAEFGCTSKTIDNWAAAHPEFLQALTLATVHSQAWWENAGQSGMTADKFNSSVWSRSMAARFPADWREASRQEHTGANGGPIQTVDLSKASDDDLNRLASILGVVVDGGAGGEPADTDSVGDHPTEG